MGLLQIEDINNAIVICADGHRLIGTGTGDEQANGLETIIRCHDNFNVTACVSDLERGHEVALRGRDDDVILGDVTDSGAS
jgi:hypothetical protein